MSRPFSHHLLVVAQLAGVALAIWPLPGSQQGAWSWLLLAAAGAGLGVLTLAHNRIGNFSIYPAPRSGSALITSGPYRHVRHPMYVALVLMMVGIAGYNAALSNLIGAIVVAAVVIAKALLEERLLRVRFVDYDAYRARTARFIPFLH